jgi:hypothetical protein
VVPAAPPFPIVVAVVPRMVNLGWACYNLNLGENRFEINSRAWRFGLIHPKPRITDCQYSWRDAYVKLRHELRAWNPTHFASDWPGMLENTNLPAAARDHLADLAGMTAYLAGRFALPPEWISLWKAEQWCGKYPASEKFLRLFGKQAPEVAAKNSSEVISAILVAEFWLTLYHREKFPWIRRWKAAQA